MHLPPDLLNRATVFQNQLDRRAHAFAALFHAASLPVGARNLRGSANKPFAVELVDRGKLISHETNIDQPSLRECEAG
jgi:hypothetical protein